MYNLELLVACSKRYETNVRNSAISAVSAPAYVELHADSQRIVPSAGRIDKVDLPIVRKRPERMLESSLRPRLNDMNPAPTVTKSEDEWKKQLPRRPAAWHRAALLKPTQPREASGPLQMRLLRRFAVLVEHQV